MRHLCLFNKSYFLIELKLLSYVRFVARKSTHNSKFLLAIY